MIYVEFDFEDYANDFNKWLEKITVWVNSYFNENADRMKKYFTEENAEMFERLKGKEVEIESVKLQIATVRPNGSKIWGALIQPKEKVKELVTN